MKDNLAGLVQRLRHLTRRRDELREQTDAGPELEETERAIERLHWRLATVARREAGDQLGDAA
ncbi:MAG TPA: hypothetical protein VMS63_04230 [Gaiellaceae bacterium]|nr:hypothetical protein [Gaiellaceae bacterium]